MQIRSLLIYMVYAIKSPTVQWLWGIHNKSTNEKQTVQTENSKYQKKTTILRGEMQIEDSPLTQGLEEIN